LSSYPSKLLWANLLEFFKGKMADLVDECVNILSRLTVMTDPGLDMNKLVDLFG
jgi:hypothetical protein